MSLYKFIQTRSKNLVIENRVMENRVMENRVMENRVKRGITVLILPFGFLLVVETFLVHVDMPFFPDKS